MQVKTVEDPIYFQVTSYSVAYIRPVGLGSDRTFVGVVGSRLSINVNEKSSD